MLCMCVNFHRPEKKHKETFLISYFSVTKRRVQGGEATSERRRRDGVYQKSARRTHAVLIPNHWRRARVSRASHAWQICATNGKAKVGSLTLSAISPIPRERTYHTREPSRFVHALPARPLKVQGGRGFGLCADEIRAFCQPSPAGEGGARSVTDEVSFVKKDLKILCAYRTFA